MDPREEDDVPFDSGDNDDPLIRNLRTEMVRLEAQLDQLMAADRELAEEAAALRVRLDELEYQIATIRDRYRRSARMYGWIAGMWGVGIGMWLSWLIRALL
ncbi:unnamed protein product [Gemmataceae bacterium]|nr:unnamed protein product [Gemmataceae bacterium]VTU00696.1 unnamed protein product [Gemmataceae bacterium]